MEKKKKQIEIALKMLEEQEEIEKIILYTGLTEKEIEQLKKKKKRETISSNLKHRPPIAFFRIY